MKNRSFKEALQRSPLLGFCSMYPAPGIIERIGPDWDWCWIDTQHGEWGMDDVIQAVRACDLAGIFSLVRVPGLEPAMIGKVLDTACHAVMIPMVENAEQAEAVARACRFAPRGNRSYGGRRPIDLYGRAYANPDQPQPLVVCQIESPAALEQADAIAAVDGVDALFFGPDDMALARGERMDTPRPENAFDRELAAMAAAARRRGKIAAGIFFGSPARLQQGLDMGYRLIVSAGDVPMLVANSRAAAAELRPVAGRAGVRVEGGEGAVE